MDDFSENSRYYKLILLKLQELYSQQTAVRTSIRASSFFKNIKTNPFKLNTANPRPIVPPKIIATQQSKKTQQVCKNRENIRFNCYNESLDTRRYIVKSVAHNKINFRENSKIQPPQMKDAYSPAAIAQRQILTKLALSHNLYVKCQLNNLNQKRTLVIGRGNNSQLIKRIFEKKGNWKVETLKKVTCQGEIIIEKEGKALTINVSQVDLLWTQKPNQDFFLAMKAQYQAINLKALKPIFQDDEKSGYNKLFSKDFAQNDNLSSPCFCATEYDYCLYSQQVIKNYNSINIVNQTHPHPLHNHFLEGRFLGDKYHLLKGINSYCFKQSIDSNNIIPFSYLIPAGKYNQFLGKDLREYWIYKPGQSSNRGQGIVFFKKFNHAVQHCHKHLNRTAIIQKYIERPLLYKGRKFDIRCYVLASNINNYLRIYWYQEGTFGQAVAYSLCKKLKNQSTSQTMQSKTKGATTGFIKKQLEDELIKEGKPSFLKEIQPKLKPMAAIAFQSAFPSLQTNKSKFQFQIFGLDFMVDQDMKPWLIQINTNPCLATTCDLLDKIITNMLNNAINIAVQPLLGPSMLRTKKRELNCQQFLKHNRFELMLEEQVLLQR